ncbi:hypothetical protein FF011L_30280 [Roseimaritima multifibrata]|uniref:Uncharacterized protein n=1 Tax=Roseimaritima multifibrata TaxID=1930274 RepID=A0A517MHA3_9BACT|nr:hypothetical protein FF011L_30280 [Roseimaritima multifibrata]
MGPVLAARPSTKCRRPERKAALIEDDRRAMVTGDTNKHRRSYPARCRVCTKSMQPLEQMDGRLTLRILPYLIGVIAWLGGKTESPPEKVPLLAPDHL